MGRAEHRVDILFVNIYQCERGAGWPRSGWEHLVKVVIPPCNRWGNRIQENQLIVDPRANAAVLAMPLC